MAHGYLGDGYGVHGEFDPDRGDEGPGEGRSEGWRGRDRNRTGMFGGWDRGPYGEDRWSDRTWSGEYGRARQSYSSNPDDHYRSWRDRHMSELDRDYADYCREREERFHHDFDAWRHQRHGSVQPLRTGMTQTGLSADPTGLAQAESETSPASSETADPIGSATLGTTPRGRSRN
jgi:hypothetical protein